MFRFITAALVTVLLFGTQVWAATPGGDTSTYLQRLEGRQLRLQQAIEHGTNALAASGVSVDPMTVQCANMRLELLKAMSANLALRRERLLKEATRPVPVRVRRKAAAPKAQLPAVASPEKRLETDSPDWPAVTDRNPAEMTEQMPRRSFFGTTKGQNWAPEMSLPSMPSAEPPMAPAPTPGMPTTGGEGRTDSPR